MDPRQLGRMRRPPMTVSSSRPTDACCAKTSFWRWTNPGLPPTTLPERHEAFVQDPSEATSKLS
jgi:hypothetical protein